MQLENGKTYQIMFSDGSMDWNYIILEHCGGDWYKTAHYLSSQLAAVPMVKKLIEASKANPTYINIAQACTIDIFD